MDGKLEFVKCELFYGDQSQGWCIMEAKMVEFYEDVVNLDPGNSMKYTVVELTKAEFDALPEFGGW